MKKTIAILLVLVIGMAGVFAADATMDVTTEVSLQNKIILSAVADLQDDYEDFFGTSAITPITEAQPVTTTKALVGNLHYFSNGTTAFTTTLEATVLSDSATTNAVTSTIGYTVYVGSGDDEVSYTTGAASGTTVTLVEAGVTDVTIGMLPINVALNESDFNNAAVATGDYEGTITFTYTAN